MAGTEFAVLQRRFDFTKWLLEHTQRFPKSLRFSLAVRIENRMLAVLEQVVVANRRLEKLPHLRQADESLEALRILVRLSHAMRLLPTNSYEFAAKEMDALGKLLGGWMRQQKSAAPKRG